jgi:hypothetical protein
MTDHARDTTVPPDAATRAAVRGMTAASDHFEGHVRRGLTYAMDPALGPDRLVRLGDVIDWLDDRTGYGGSFTSADDVKDAIALHFGGGR